MARKFGSYMHDFQKAHGEIFQVEVMMSVNNSQIVHREIIRLVERGRGAEKSEREEETDK